MKNIRAKIGIALIRLSNSFYKLTRILCVCILRPRDLIELTRSCYSLPAYTTHCSNPAYLQEGLTVSEQAFVGRYVPAHASICVLGCGGGRECLALAQRGFAVTGIDFIEDCIASCRAAATEKNLPIQYVCHDITQPGLSLDTRFDAIMLPAILYSLIPSLRIRTKLIHTLVSLLNPAGYIFLTFLSTQEPACTHQTFKNILALVTCGNTHWQEGDYVEGDGEFKHYFHETGIKNELLQCGLHIAELNLTDGHASFAIVSKHPL